MKPRPEITFTVDGVRDEIAALRAEIGGLRDELLSLLGALGSLDGSPEARERFARRAAYRQEVACVRRCLCAATPAGSRVLVVSKGDPDLVRLDGREGGHFPQDADGVWAGHHPASSAAAVAELEALRERGAEYLAIPASYGWWLDHYAGLRSHLERTYRRLCQDDLCTLYALAEASPWRALSELVLELKVRTRRNPAVLDWDTAAGLDGVLPECVVFSPLAADAAELPYLPETIDIVAVADPARLGEARRIALHAVVRFGAAAADGDAGGLTIERVDGAADTVAVAATREVER